MDLLHATIEFAADGYTHVECYCPRCRVIRLKTISYLPRIAIGLSLAPAFPASAVKSAWIEFSF
jgi:hypothetical protein